MTLTLRKSIPPITSIYANVLNSSPSAEGVHSWIASKLPDKPHPAIHRPINWTRIIAIATTVLGTVTFGTVAWPYLLPVIQNRNIWAAISLIMILLFTSGHMFNHIRKVPYVVGDGRGGVSYFAGGFQNQYGLETQIIAAMCEFYFLVVSEFRLTWNLDGLLSFATISLALKVPRISDPKTQQLAVFLWSGVIFLMYSFLLSVFRIKNGGYPFWLPPFS